MKTRRINQKVQRNGLRKQERVAVLSSLINRMALANQIGTQSYGGDRNVYDALGYKSQLFFEDYLARYYRQDIAKAIIDRPVQASWKGDIAVIENTKEKETKFEKKWRKLYDRLNLKGVFIRSDKLTGLGSYSIIFLGLDDATTNDGLSRKVRKGANLEYVKPFSEKSATIHEWETNRKHPRYGKPKLYKIVIRTQSNSALTAANNASDGGFQDELIVHYSRVIHVVEDILEDEVFGLPRLQVVFNRLMDLEKLIGGDAEMFWRGARPGITGTVKEDYEMTDDMFEAIESQLEEFEHNFKRVLVNEGIDYKTLAQQIADPTAHVDVQVQMISAVTGIPKRILTGSERGELSSAQDKQEWISYVTSRREEQNEPGILRPFINHLIKYGILPMPKEGEFDIIWDKLFSLSDKEKVELGKNRAISLKEWSTNPAAQYMMPYEMFLLYVMGLDKNQISQIVEHRKAKMEELGEKELTIEEIAELNAKATRQFERTSENDSRTEDGSNRESDNDND